MASGAVMCAGGNAWLIGKMAPCAVDSRFVFLRLVVNVALVAYRTWDVFSCVSSPTRERGGWVRAGFTLLSTPRAYLVPIREAVFAFCAYAGPVHCLNFSAAIADGTVFFF